jgi:hypothetical protein
MIDIGTAFAATSQSIAVFFQRPGVSYYIPLYQRAYSWDSDNIEKLMEDICSGVIALNPSTSNESIRFLGTVILVREQHPTQNIQPQDPQGLPPTIFNVIDGQQRISTIAMLACLLYKRISLLKNALPTDPLYDGLRQATALYLPPLLDIFSVDLLLGNPTRKPIIIRGSEDRWTLSGGDNNYPSDVASMLASTIRSITFATPFVEPNAKNLVGTNVSLMNRWLDHVEQAHKKLNEIFPPAWKILEQISETDLWGFSRPELSSIVNNCTHPPQGTDSQVCSLVQLFAFSHFLLRRCCFTEIVPISERWAFDMFQSLNATGTPLTAIETFKPLVVNYFGSKYKDSDVENDFDQIDILFKPMKNASDKSKLTRNYLTTFALIYDGTAKLSSRFSDQRDWLNGRFNTCSTSIERVKFVRKMSDLAVYWQRLNNYNPGAMLAFPGLEGLPQDLQRLSGLSLLYINNANHDMAHSVLSRFYSSVLNGDPNSTVEFANACTAVAAFFTLWRSALPNAGLDDEYRSIVKEYLSWKIAGNTQLKADDLKYRFREALEDNKIGSFTAWKSRALSYLRYDNAKTVCRFVLFVTAHDTIGDPAFPGLMIKGNLGTALYLDPVKWQQDDCRSIEHVAPQDEKAGWDQALYLDDDVQRIGNLILLSTEINSAVGNRGWLEKWIYYRHIQEENPNNFPALMQQASSNGINLKNKFLATLKKTPVQHHMKPIVGLGANGVWNKDFVDARTERICELLWDRLYNEWLS